MGLTPVETIDVEIRERDDASKISYAINHLVAIRELITAVRDRKDRADPRGRELSLAITHLEDAETRLAKAV